MEEEIAGMMYEWIRRRSSKDSADQFFQKYNIVKSEVSETVEDLARHKYGPKQYPHTTKEIHKPTSVKGSADEEHPAKSKPRLKPGGNPASEDGKKKRRLALDSSDEDSTSSRPRDDEETIRYSYGFEKKSSSGWNSKRLALDSSDDEASVPLLSPEEERWETVDDLVRHKFGPKQQPHTSKEIHKPTFFKGATDEQTKSKPYLKQGAVKSSGDGSKSKSPAKDSSGPSVPPKLGPEDAAKVAGANYEWMCRQTSKSSVKAFFRKHRIAKTKVEFTLEDLVNFKYGPIKERSPKRPLKSKKMDGSNSKDSGEAPPKKAKKNAALAPSLQPAIEDPMGEGTKTCPYCLECFAPLYNIEHHILICRSRLKEFPCPKCTSSFALNQTLTQHLKEFHEGKRFKCEVCAKLFVTAAVLTVHLRIHSGEKPFECSVCSGSYSDPSGFRKHLLTHTEDKPFICALCKRGFNDRSNLAKHVSAAHDPSKAFFPCSICCCAFELKKGLSNHMAKTHPILPSL